MLASQSKTRSHRDQISFPTLLDQDTEQQESVRNCKQACTWLENKNLLVLLDSKITLPMLSATLFHILELAKVLKEVVQAIHSVAWLLGKLEEETVAEATRAAVNKHIDYMNIETKNLLDEIRITISEEVEKQLGTINSTAAKALEERTASPSSYQDMLLRNAPISHGVDPRILAREGIRARQFIVDTLGDSLLKNLNQVEVLKCFNEAMEKAGRDLEERARKIRSVTKLPNKGYLGEFLQDKGAKWFSHSNHADEFITALGLNNTGASIKKCNHLMIAFYVLLNLNTENPWVDGLEEDDLILCL
jgi:hypothetical protein